MDKVYGMHEVELRSGVKGEDFEKFFREEYAPSFQPEGTWTVHLIKGDRGARADKYLVMYEIASVEERDRYVQASVTPSTAVQRELEPSPATAAWQKIAEQWKKFAAKVPGIDDIYTDYVEVAL
jgi:hypothetical protein